MLACTVKLDITCKSSKIKKLVYPSYVQLHEEVQNTIYQLTLKEFMRI